MNDKLTFMQAMVMAAVIVAPLVACKLAVMLVKSREKGAER